MLELRLGAFCIADFIERLASILRCLIADRPTVDLANCRHNVLQTALLLGKRDDHIIEDGILVESVIPQELVRSIAEEPFNLLDEILIHELYDMVFHLSGVTDGFARNQFAALDRQLDSISAHLLIEGFKQIAGIADRNVRMISTVVIKNAISVIVFDKRDGIMNGNVG